MNFFKKGKQILSAEGGIGQLGLFTYLIIKAGQSAEKEYYDQSVAHAQRLGTGLGAIVLGTVTDDQNPAIAMSLDQLGGVYYANGDYDTTARLW